jgi:hypothetical protein
MGLVKDIISLNSNILERLETLSRSTVTGTITLTDNSNAGNGNDNRIYIANTRIVARHRLRIVQDAMPQLDKNPNKIGKVEQRIIGEMGFGFVKSSLGELVQQAQEELVEIEDKIKQQKE